MPVILLDNFQLNSCKLELGRLHPDVQPGHRSEAIARGFGFETYASLRSAIAETGVLRFGRTFDVHAFYCRVEELKYASVPRNDGALIKLFSPRSFFERVNGFGVNAITDLSWVVNLRPLQARFVEEVLLTNVITNDGSANITSLSGVITALGISFEEFASRDFFCPPLIPNEAHVAKYQAPTMGLFWGLASTMMTGQLKQTPESPGVIHSVEILEGADTVSFCIDPPVLKFLRMRQRLFTAPKTVMHPTDENRKHLATISSLIHELGNDLRNLGVQAFGPKFSDDVGTPPPPAP
jgi:hypothetical protein